MKITIVKITKRAAEDNLISEILYEGKPLDSMSTSGDPVLGLPIFFEHRPGIIYHTEPIIRVKGNYLYSLNAKYTWNQETK